MLMPRRGSGEVPVALPPTHTTRRHLPSLGAECDPGAPHAIHRGWERGSPVLLHRHQEMRLACERFWASEHLWVHIRKSLAPGHTPHTW